MATSFPTTRDDFTNPTSAGRMGDPGIEHHLQHANANDAIEAIETKIGIDGSTNPATLDYRVDASEVLYWMSI